MDKLTIDGKDFEFNITWGRFEKSAKLREKQKDESENVKFLIEDIWLYLERRFFLKPFIFKCRLKNKIRLKEIGQADEKITAIITELLEGKEGKNSVE